MCSPVTVVKWDARSLEFPVIDNRAFSCGFELKSRSRSRTEHGHERQFELQRNFAARLPMRTHAWLWLLSSDEGSVFIFLRNRLITFSLLTLMCDFQTSSAVLVTNLTCLGSSRELCGSVKVKRFCSSEQSVWKVCEVEVNPSDFFTFFQVDIEVKK